MKIAILFLLSLFVAAAARADDQGPVPGCYWAPGDQKIGTACGDSQEYSGWVISCESSPLYFWVEEDCGGGDHCAVALEIDGEVTNIGVGKYVVDGLSGVSVPLGRAKKLLLRLKKAKRLRTIVGGKTSINLPIDGLSASIDSLIAACPTG